jgi:hypothetical protein
MLSSKAAGGAVLELRRAQQSDVRLCHVWLDAFARWIDSGACDSTNKNIQKDKNKKEQEASADGLVLAVWDNVEGQRCDMWREDWANAEYRWASFKLHCWLFRQQLDRRPRSVGRLAVGFDGQSRARKSERRRGRGQVEGRCRVRPRIVPKGWDAWPVGHDWKERERQPYGMSGGDIDWVFAIEAPVEGDWRSVAFSGVATFAVSGVGGASVWEQLATSVDSMAMVNCVVQSVVQPDWKWMSRDGSQVRGMEGQGVATVGKVEIPNHAMVYQGRRRGLVCSVVSSMPRDIQLLIGLPTIHSDNYRLLLDLTGARVYVRAARETMRLDKLERVVRRLRAAPGTVLSLCSGLCVELYVMLELGYRVKEVLVVESSDFLCAMLAKTHGKRVRVIATDVTTLHIEELLDCVPVKLLAAFAGPTCTPWSCLRDDAKPKGFDDPKSQVFVACAHLLNELEFYGLLDQSMLETVVIRKDRGADLDRQRLCLGGELVLWNAADSGSAASRPRMYHVRGMDMTALSKVPHVNPSLMLALGWRLEREPAPCLVATRVSKSVAWVRNNEGDRRELDSDERDAINPGLAVGVSNAFGVYKVSAVARDAATGNCFSADVVWAVARMWKSLRTVPAVLVMDDFKLMSQSDLMLVFRSWTREKVLEWVDYKAATLIMPLMDIEAMITEQNTVPYQTTAPGWCKAGFEASCEHCVDSAIRDKTHVNVEYDSNFWIYLLFFQAKAGRKVIALWDGTSYKTGDELCVMRPLRDYRALNAAIARGLPVQWREFCPTVEASRGLFPSWCKFMAVHDSKNAFHSMMLTEGSRRLCVSKFKDGKGMTRYIQAVGGDQGCSACALFFTVWVRHGYNHFFGTAWEEWWSDFIDDTIVFGTDQDDCDLKLFVLNAVKIKMGLHPSPKQDVSSKKEVLFAGLVWTLDGITIGSAGREHILSVLDKEPGGVSQCRTFRGVLVQARSAFKFSAEEIIEFGRLLVPITTAIDVVTKGGKWKWTVECKASAEAFRVKLVDQPKAYTNPDTVLTGESCLMILGDADPNAIVTSLWVVFRNDARDVQVADLMEDGRALLLNLHPKSLCSSQARWHISEKELYAMVLGVRKFGSFISSVVGRWAVSANKEEWTWHRGQLVVPIPKIVLGSDSSSALGMLLQLMVPGGRIDYITPKLARLMGYADDCACTLYWPMARLQLPGGGAGPCNSLCDFLCRLVGQLKRMQDVRTLEDEEELEELPYGEAAQDAVLCVLVIDGEDPESIESDEVPAGMKVREMLLDESDWHEIHRAYACDCDSTYQSIRVLDVYLVFNDEFEGSETVRRTVEAWRGKLLFPMERWGRKAVYTMATTVRVVDVEMKEPSLVLVVPAGACVQVSRTEMPTAEEQEGMAEWAVRDMRSDILWWAHQGKWPHSRKVATIDRAMSIAWWSLIEKHATYHATTCTVCVPVMKARIEIGLGSGSIVPFYVIQMDDLHVRHDVIKASHGKITSVAVLCFTCIATGVTVFCLRPDFGSTSAALCYFKHWFKRFGGSAVLWSDNAAPYLAAMMTVVAELCGMRRRMLSTLGSHASYAERRLGVLNRVIQEAFMQGQLRTEQDLELAVAGAEMEINHFTLCDGATPMERAGLMIMPSAEMLAPTHWQQEIATMTAEEVLARVKDIDDQQVAMIVRDRCEMLQGMYRIGQDKRARGNYARRVAVNERKQGFGFMHENEGMQVGDVVDWKGQMWAYIKDDGLDVPVRLFLSKVKAPRLGEERWVMLEELRPIAIGREELKLPRAVTDECSVLDTVAYDWDGEVHVGMVLDVDEVERTVKVHVMEHKKNKTGITFLMNWTGGPAGKVDKRCEQCPAGYIADVREIELEAVKGRVTLMGNHKLCDDSLAFLEGLGVETFSNGV